jgi:pyrimidine-nucleoside phosphorylase
MDSYDYLPKAQHTMELRSKASGYVASIACEQVGTASVVLGGGREKKEDAVDPAVGLVLHKKVGDAVIEGESICTIHHNSDARLHEAVGLLEHAYRITNSARFVPQPLVHRVIEGKPSTQAAGAEASWPY